MYVVGGEATWSPRSVGELGNLQPACDPSACLKAVWPDFCWGGVFLRSGRSRGPGKAFQNVGGEATHIFKGFPGPAGPARPQTRTPKNPARLPSGTQPMHSPFTTLKGTRSVGPSSSRPPVEAVGPASSLELVKAGRESLG
jgi:hypothetical protein